MFALMDNKCAFMFAFMDNKCAFMFAFIDNKCAFMFAFMDNVDYLFKQSLVWFVCVDGLHCVQRRLYKRSCLHSAQVYDHTGNLSIHVINITGNIVNTIISSQVT